MEDLIPNSKRTLMLSGICTALLSFVQFLLYYIPFGFFYESSALLLTCSYLTSFLEALFPIIAALMIFLAKEKGLKNKILPSLLISLCRLFYSIPYYYIYYVSDVFNSGEAIMLALLISILFVSAFFLQTFVCVSIMYCVEKRANKSPAERKRTGIFDIDDHVNFGTVLSVIFIFVIFFIRECIDTVEYLIDNRGSYRIEEIATIVLSFLLIFAFAFIHYTLSVFIKNRLLANTENER